MQPRSVANGQPRARATPTTLGTIPLSVPRIYGKAKLVFKRNYNRKKKAVKRTLTGFIYARLSRPLHKRFATLNKGYGLKCPGWWECSLAAISQTTIHMHGHHEATMGLAGVSLGRELRALALSHTASVRRGTA